MIPLMPQYRAWVDFSVHAVPVGWGEQFPGQSPNAHCMPCSTGVLLISVQERRRAGGERLGDKPGAERAQQGQSGPCFAGSGPCLDLMLPVAGRVAAQRGSWFFSSRDLNCRFNSSACCNTSVLLGRPSASCSAARHHRWTRTS